MLNLFVKPFPIVKDVLKTRPISSVVRWFPSVMIACSLTSIVALLQIDTIVNQGLYSYNLQLSYDWATPYWTAMRLVLVMAGLVTIVAVMLQIFLVTRKNVKQGGEVKKTEPQQERHWNTYKLGDGATIRVKSVLKAVKRLDKQASDGTPIYVVATDNVVQVVNVPERLRGKSEEQLLKVA